MSYGPNVAVAAATSMFLKVPLEGRCVTFRALGRVKCENVAVAAARSIFFQNTWEHLGAPYSKMLLWLQREACFKGALGHPGSSKLLLTARAGPLVGISKLVLTIRAEATEAFGQPGSCS